MTKSSPLLIPGRRAAFIFALAMIAALGLLLSEVWAEKPPDETPTSLTAQVVAEGIQLTWDAPQARLDEVDGDYVTQTRAGADGGAGETNEFDRGSNELTYLDAAANIEGDRYTYQVAARREDVTSEASNEVTVIYDGSVSYIRSQTPALEESNSVRAVASTPVPLSFGFVPTGRNAPTVLVPRLYTQSGSNYPIAQKFTTGSKEYGYLLTSVEVHVTDVEPGGRLDVQIRSSNGLIPAGCCVVRFMRPSVLSDGANVFLAPEGTMLEPETEYFLFMEAKKTNAFVGCRSDISVRTYPADQRVEFADWQIEDYGLTRQLEPVEQPSLGVDQWWFRSGRLAAFPYGVVIEPIQVRGVGVLERVRSLVAVWKMNQAVDDYQLQWRRPNQTWEQALKDGQETTIAAESAQRPETDDEVGTPIDYNTQTSPHSPNVEFSTSGLGHTIGNLSPFVRYEVRVLGLSDDHPERVIPSLSVIGSARDEPPEDVGPDLDQFIRRIGPPAERPLGQTVLPEERIKLKLAQMPTRQIVVQGHEWSPSGLWGDPDADYLYVEGIWSDGETIWLSGPVTRLRSGATPSPPDGIYTLDISSGELNQAAGFERYSDGAGIWSDGTTMWVAVPGWLRAYQLDGGIRHPALDVQTFWDRTPATSGPTARRVGSPTARRRASRPSACPGSPTDPTEPLGSGGARLRRRIPP